MKSTFLGSKYNLSASNEFQLSSSQYFTTSSLILLEPSEYFPQTIFLVFLYQEVTFCQAEKEPEPPNGAKTVKSQSLDGYECGQTCCSLCALLMLPAGRASSALLFKVSFGLMNISKILYWLRAHAMAM